MQTVASWLGSTEEKGEEETAGILQSLFRSTPEITLILPTRPHLSKLPLHPSTAMVETKP